MNQANSEPPTRTLLTEGSSVLVVVVCGMGTQMTSAMGSQMSMEAIVNLWVCVRKGLLLKLTRNVRSPKSFLKVLLVDHRQHRMYVCEIEVE